MKTLDSEYFNLLNKYYPGLSFDSVNSISDIASQIGINRKDSKLIERLFEKEEFITLVQKMNGFREGNRKFRKIVERITSKFNSIYDKFKDVDLKNEKIAEKLAITLNNKILPLLLELEDFLYDNCVEYAALCDWSVEPEFILYEIPEVSSRDDSNFKCIIGYYKSKYRRTNITSDTSFINASCVCGGGN